MSEALFAPSRVRETVVSLEYSDHTASQVCVLPQTVQLHIHTPSLKTRRDDDRRRELVRSLCFDIGAVDVQILPSGMEWWRS